MQRTTVASGYAYEESFGYARAVRVGNHVYVAGTTARGADIDGDGYVQMTAAIAIVRAALIEAGAELAHVVRTVTYVVDMSDEALVARAHREAFGGHRPTSTLVVVSGLYGGARVEIEVTAMVHD